MISAYERHPQNNINQQPQVQPVTYPALVYNLGAARQLDPDSKARVVKYKHINKHNYNKRHDPTVEWKGVL